MKPIPAKIAAAVGAWASLVAYAVLTLGFIGNVRALDDAATAPPKLDVGLTGLAALLGTAVVGVIAGLTGVSIAQTGIRSMPSRLGEFLVVVRNWEWVATVATALYLLVYFGVAVAALLVWGDKGTDLTPEFLRTQVLAAAGLVAAMAALNASK